MSTAIFTLQRKKVRNVDKGMIFMYYIRTDKGKYHTGMVKLLNFPPMDVKNTKISLRIFMHMKKRQSIMDFQRKL